MVRYLIQRACFAALTVWFVSLAVFVLLRVSPGDPLLTQQGMSATPERLAALRAEHGLDRPLHIQYRRWLLDLVKGDLGRSPLTQARVADEIADRFPVSLQLTLMTLAWVALGGVSLGALAAWRRGSRLDAAVRVTGSFGIAMPAFWIATLVLMLPAQMWHYAPPLGETAGLLSDPVGNLRQFLPPSLVLALAPAALVMRLTRSGLLDVVHKDYVRTARAKGLDSRTLFMRHTLRNALIPLVTVLGLVAAELLAGSVMIESIFNLRGLGSYLYDALFKRDYLVAQTMVLYVTLTVVLCNLAVDILYGLIDPRIRR
jgi:peptide/nickel transport system permease protein